MSRIPDPGKKEAGVSGAEAGAEGRGEGRRGGGDKIKKR